MGGVETGDVGATTGEIVLRTSISPVVAAVLLVLAPLMAGLQDPVLK